MISCPEDVERERIRAWARGWNDAMRGRAPRDNTPGYALGYLDATR
jgi:hypothetical protein